MSYGVEVELAIRMTLIPCREDMLELLKRMEDVDGLPRYVLFSLSS